MSKRTERCLLAAILVTFAVLATIYSIVVPPFEASDELWHFPMVKYVADHWTLPVQDPANVGPWRQEGSQPPLYYYVGALVTSWIDTSDIDQVRHLNPHVDIGVATLDGNVNLVVHDPDREAFPWSGTTLAVHLVRVLSVAMSTVAVCLTWLIVREVTPDRPCLALGAAGIHAFTPMYVFISGAVNNDNLVVPLSSLALLLLLQLLRDGEPADCAGGSRARSNALALAGDGGSGLRRAARNVPVARYLVLGIVMGLAALTKTSSLALTLLTALVVIVRAVRRRSWSEFVIGGLATALPVLLIAGWWYLRNLRLYGDPSGLNVFIEILGQRDVPADLAQLWRERFSFAAGYWGNFGGLNVPMPDWAYRILNWLAVISAAGLAVELVLWLARSVRRRAGHPVPPPRLSKIRSLPFLVCLTWGVGVLVPWSQWASVTWSSQGRLVFTAIPVWSMLLALGLTAWVPRLWGRFVLALLVLFLFALSTCAPFAWIAPAYALPEPLTATAVSAIRGPLHIDFRAPTQDGTDAQTIVRLLGYEIGSEAVQPGDQLPVTLYWEALAPASGDLTVFVHLLGEGDLLVAQRDTFPGLGLLSAASLEPGSRWADRYILQLPATAYTPGQAQIEVGVFDPQSGARLAARDLDGAVMGDHVRFGRVDIPALDGEIPNPVWVSFGDRMALVGYDLDQRVSAPGEEIALTLYWKALRPMSVDYTVSAQLVDSQQSKAAQNDGWPQSGAAPTTTWEPAEIVAETRTLAISPDAAPGVYDVRVAAYWLDGDEIRHLPVIPPGGQMLADHVVLTQARVTHP